MRVWKEGKGRQTQRFLLRSVATSLDECIKNLMDGWFFSSLFPCLLFLSLVLQFTFSFSWISVFHFSDHDPIPCYNMTRFHDSICCPPLLEVKLSYKQEGESNRRRKELERKKLNELSSENSENFIYVSKHKSKVFVWWWLCVAWRVQ